jgi:tetratricopeptide (TPR) repeat protein
MHNTTLWRLPRATAPRVLFVALVVAASVLLGAIALAAPEPTAPQNPDASSFDDPVEPFVPLKKRSPREDDHIRALALFAAGRVAEQKQNYAEALRSYQRAFRFDPQAMAALREIVPLAFNLDREEEGVRYALILAERDPSDANLLRRLAMYLTEEGQTERALKLYEKALELQEAKSEKPSASAVLMWMEMGRLYFLAKQFDQAAKNFAQVSTALANPKDYDLSEEVEKALLNKGELTYQLFGESFLEAGRLDEALAAFEKGNTYKADESLLLYNQARIEAKRKQPAQALAKLETYLEKHFSSQGTGPYDLYVEVLKELGQEDQIDERLEKQRAGDGTNIPLNYFIAERYRKADQLDKAAPIYAALIAQRKERPPLEAITGLIDIYRQQKQAAKLLDLLGESVGRVGSLSPLGETGDKLIDDKSIVAGIIAEARIRIAAAASAAGAKDAATDKAPEKDADKPESGGESKLFAKVIAPDYGQLVAAALLAMAVEDYDNAQLLFDAALDAEGVKPGEAVAAWGLELFANGQYDRAIQVFERGLKDKVLPDDNPALAFYLAGALEMAGRTDEAIERAKEAAAKKQDSPRFASRIAWVQFHAKRLDDARKAYLALLDEYDKNHESSEVRDVMRDARLVLSNIAAMQDDLDQAEEWLEQVLDEFPEDTGALNDLGYLWADAGKHLDRALEMIQVAVAEDPKNMAYRDSLGWVLLRLGRYPEAVAELKVAAAVPDPDGVILDHLAEAQLLNGEVAAAIESWRRALELFEKEQDAEKAQQTREKIKQAEAQATESAAVPEPKPATPSQQADESRSDE